MRIETTIKTSGSYSYYLAYGKSEVDKFGDEIFKRSGYISNPKEAPQGVKIERKSEGKYGSASHCYHYILEVSEDFPHYILEIGSGKQSSGKQKILFTPLKQREKSPEVEALEKKDVEPPKPMQTIDIPATPIPSTPERRKEWVNTGLIKMDEGTQLPGRRNEATVQDYAQQMEDGEWEWEREPLPILFWSEAEQCYYPGDGHHRTEAAAISQMGDIFTEIRIGGLVKAKLCSAQANRFHGLQLTNEDKRQKVIMVLSDPAVLEELATALGQPGTMPSDRAIATYLGVSAPLVGKIRAELEQAGTVNISSEKVDKRGRKVNTANIGTKEKGDKPSAKAKVMQALEDCSLEELAEIQEEIDSLIERMR